MVPYLKLLVILNIWFPTLTLFILNRWYSTLTLSILNTWFPTLTLFILNTWFPTWNSSYIDDCSRWEVSLWSKCTRECAGVRRRTVQCAMDENSKKIKVRTRHRFLKFLFCIRHYLWKFIRFKRGEKGFFFSCCSDIWKYNSSIPSHVLSFVKWSKL